MQCLDKFKVSIVGLGNVGATMAYSMLLDGTPTDLCLIDINKDKAHGVMLDLEHSLSFVPYTKLTASDDVAETANSSLIVITAGAATKGSQSRLELIDKNREIFKKIIPTIADNSPNAIILVVTNPVDVLTYETLKLSGFDKSKVIGSGTILDTARFQFHISQKLGVHPSNINAYILGEHGDSSFPALSCADIAGRPLREFAEFTEEVEKQSYEETRTAAYRIINDLGYTCYSISTATVQIMKAIFEDSNEVFALSTLLDDFYEEGDVCMSVPCVLGRDGIKKRIVLPLDREEKTAFKKSAQILRSLQK